MTAHNIDTLRVAFSDSGYNVPPIHAPRGPADWYDVLPDRPPPTQHEQIPNGVLCFEELLVPRNEYFIFRDPEEADGFRHATLGMCRLSSSEQNSDRCSSFYTFFLDSQSYDTNSAPPPPPHEVC